ncbi:MAG: hypothetical protein HGA22_07100 [Clostridiales bacterium]|nr:hypothetical protein [Clostridiales bacterium]
MLLLALNTMLLLAADVILVAAAIPGGKAGRRLSELLEGYDKAQKDRRYAREVIKYNRSVAFRMSVLEKMELFLIDKSNIRRHIPFMNSKILIAVSGIIFLCIFKPLYSLIGFIPTAAVISALFSMIPLFALDILARYNSELVRKRLAEFISILSRWCIVREDLFYAFEKTALSGIGEPLSTFVKDMVIQVERGIDPTEALDILQLKVDNAQFRDFIVNIKQNIKHRGNINALLANLEEQFYKIEEEYNRRRISTYKDRLLIFFVMLTVLFTGWFFLRLNPQVAAFYLGTVEGKLLLALFSILYSIGFYLSLGIAKFKY